MVNEDTNDDSEKATNRATWAAIGEQENDAKPHPPPPYARTVRLKVETLGTENPDILRTTVQPSETFPSLSVRDEARRLCRQALERVKKVLGIAHRDTIDSAIHLEIMLELQRKRDALGMSRRLELEERGGLLGKEHPDTLRRVNDLAEVLREMRKYDRQRSCTGGH
jgi:hypothetical protein